MRVREYYDKRKEYEGGEGPEQEILLSRSERKKEFEECLDRVMENPRWYLDNLEYLPVFDAKMRSPAEE